MNFKVEKGIPIPGSLSEYPFAQMEPNDSFLIKNEQLRIVQNAIRTYKDKNSGTSFTIRKVNDGHRVWRTG